MQPNKPMTAAFSNGQPAEDLHHIFFGRGRRKISDDHNLVIPLTVEEHQKAHGPKAREHAEKYCEYMGIDFDKTLLAINSLTNPLKKRDAKKYLNGLTIKMAVKLKTLELDSKYET